MDNPKKKIKIDDTCQIQLDEESFVDYYAGFMSSDFADELLNKLLSEIPWREVTRNGKDGEYIIPRRQCWMSDYAVDAGLTQKEPALEWSNEILMLKTLIEDELKNHNINRSISKI